MEDSTMNDHTGMAEDSGGGEQAVMSTRERILDSAVGLFAAKGYTETSMRELATSVGLKVSALYYHFPSKNAILESILNDYTTYCFSDIGKEEMMSKLKDNPTPAGVLSCMRLRFPAGKEDYYLKMLCVILQEQHRNPVICDFMKDMIYNGERQIGLWFEIFKELGVFRQDAEPDYWMKIVSCLLYSFASRTLLGIGDNTPEYFGMGMVDLLKATFELMFQTCSVTAE